MPKCNKTPRLQIRFRMKKPYFIFFNADSYNKLFNEFNKKKTNFEDHFFKSDATSLFNTRKLSLIKAKKYVWKRIKDIYAKSKLKLFTTIDPNNIVQKDLCNFYFGAAISSLAEKPHRISNLFNDQNYNEIGCYYVRICQDGVWRFIIIDDYIPINLNDEKRPAFIGPRFANQEIEIYAMLLEKAYSKIFSGYQNIEWGNVADCIQDLTGNFS